MPVRHPRLLAGSLAVAMVVGLVLGVVVATSGDDGGSGVDASLTDPLDRQPQPGDALTNADVEGERLPEALLTDRDGNDVSTADLLGQPLVVNFWFSTCPPCAKELPAFAEVHRELGDRVRFVGVNTIDSVPVMERFAGDRGVDYELYRDPAAELTDGIGATAFPVTVFVDSSGVIVDQTGAIDAGELRERIDALLAADAAGASEGST